MVGAATIEINTSQEQDFLLWEKEFKTSPLLHAEELYADAFESVKLELPRTIGSVALAGTQETTRENTHKDSTLQSKLRLANNGNEQARSMVHTNIATDVAERLFKTAHQTVVPLEMQNGRLIQDQTPLIEINKNTFRHMELNGVMRERTNIECRNTLVFEKLIEAGALDHYDVVVFSNTPIDPQTRKEYRFFTDTDSLSIQYLKKQDDAFIMETAMYAGKKHKDAERHDFRLVSELMGRDVEPSDNELLRNIMLVPKRDSGGVHSIVEHLDTIEGDVFYGEEQPRQDYEAYRAVCAQRTEDFEDIVSNVMHDLMQQSKHFSSPYDAIEKLDELSDKYCVNAAVTRHDIDVRVFGATAAAHIEDARFFQGIGEHERAQLSLTKAEQTSQSGSCPFSGKKNGGINGESELASDGEDEFGSLSFSCPSCKKKNTRKPGKKNFLTNCKHCSADVTC